MNNILLFVIDSLNYSRIKEAPHLMPCLRALEEQGLSCSEMYSQAPYTEAAVMNLYCGQNVLDYGGYINRFKDSPCTLFEAMEQKGYSTYYNSFQPQCYPSSLRRGVSDLFYNVGYDLGALWSYRLSHFAQLYKSGDINHDDYEQLKDIFNDNFQEWILFANELLSDSDSVSMISGNSPDYNAEQVLEKVKSEYENFLADNVAYINSVLTEGTSHPLFKIPAYVQNGKIAGTKAIEDINSLFKPLFKKIRRRGIKLNLLNGGNVTKGPMGKFASFLRQPNKSSLKNFAKSAYLSVDHIADVDLYQRIGPHPDWFKNAPSARAHIDHFINWSASREEGNKPFFACIHVDDVHNPEVFFTYDSSDPELLAKEFKDAEDVLDNLPSDFSGSITHDLSLKYIDGIIRYLYESMEEQSLLDETYIAICADHGFSFSGRPLRDSFVNNFYLENYNIPFVITGPELKHERISTLHSSKDIPATLCYLADQDVPSCFTGKAIQKKEGYPKLTVEYCGGGCPDLSRRDLKIAAFDNDYFVAVHCKAADEASHANVVEVYDLQQDPKQLTNIKRENWDVGTIDAYLGVINKRLSEIRGSMPSPQGR